MDFIESFRTVLDKFWTSFAKSLSILVASVFLIFSFGMLLGYLIAMQGWPTWILMIPPLLGVIGYYYRTMAVVGFAIFVLFLLL